MECDIYSVFNKELKDIVNKHRDESLTFPKEIKQLNEYYLRERLVILDDESNHMAFDPRMGKPIPYLAFWFAKTFGLQDNEIIKKLGLSLTYICISLSVRDDLVDGKLASEAEHICLANLYYDKYFNIFRDLFPPRSRFWFILSDCLNEWSKYESWNFLFNNEHFDPFSEQFLLDSSRYLVAVTLPTLAAIAVITRNERKIPQLAKFLRHYYMAFRIIDDIRDWQKDIYVRNYNHSSIIHYALSRVKSQHKTAKESTLSLFLDTTYIKNIYNIIITFLRASKHDIIHFNSPYLTKFIDLQIDFHSQERDTLSLLKDSFNLYLNNVLSSDETKQSYLST